MAVEANRTILVVDTRAGTQPKGALFRVDPLSGARTVLSDFGSGANPGQSPVGVAVEANGTILVVNVRGDMGVKGTLFRVDPLSGARTVLSDFGSGANPGQSPFGVAVEANGTILVADITYTRTAKGALFRVDPMSGARAVLSDFGAGANPGVNPSGVAVEANGTILVVDGSAGTDSKGALFRVDPISGARTVLSDFGVGADPWGVAVVPAKRENLPLVRHFFLAGGRSLLPVPLLPVPVFLVFGATFRRHSH